MTKDNKSNTGHWNTGDCNTGNSNTGNSNTGHRNTGYSNTGNSNAGYSNTGHWNTGDRNTGGCNTGYSNTGDWNTGDCNTGDRNTGYSNTGERNTGNWNTCDKEVGFFNTKQHEKVRVFNEWVYRDVWDNADKPSFLYFTLTEWVYEFDMTDQEKIDNNTFHTTGGYLKSYEYKEAFQKSYNEAPQEEKDMLLKLPNFDADVFKEISGIDVGKASCDGKTVVIEGVEYELKRKTVQ